MFRSFIANDKRLPSRGGSVAQPEPPVSVQRAVKFMLAGAAASTVFLIFGVIVTANVKSALTAWNATLPAKQQYTATQISNAATSYIVSTIIVGLIAIALWLWMARMNNRGGRSWARIAATVFFALWTFYTYQNIGGTRGSATFVAALVIILVIWLIGLASLYFLWRPDSTAYYKSAPSGS
jgi:hypothetical protein